MTITVAPRRRAYEALLATTTRARIAWQRFADRRILGQLADSNPLGTRLVACFDRLDPQTSAEHARIHAIEQERRRMLNDDSPLIDGSEAEPGLYDKGQTIGAVTKVSKSPRGALLLYQFIREFRPQLVVELGTNVGISAAYQAAALNENANGGRLVTLEASPYRLRLAKSLHAKLGLENISYVQGLFSDTLQSALAEHGHRWTWRTSMGTISISQRSITSRRCGGTPVRLPSSCSMTYAGRRACCVRGRSCAPTRASRSRWTLVLSASDSEQPAVHEPRPERCTQCCIRGIPLRKPISRRGRCGVSRTRPYLIGVVPTDSGGPFGA